VRRAHQMLNAALCITLTQVPSPLV